MPRDEAAYLLDILHTAQDVEEFASGLTFHQFERSRLHRNAILKSIEVIGEATTRITEESRLAHPDRNSPARARKPCSTSIEWSG